MSSNSTLPACRAQHSKVNRFHNQQGGWQKRYFVLKDSFLFWYDRKVTVPFEKRCKGCVPLGGCSVFPMGKDGDDFVFEVTHPDFGGKSLILKTTDKSDVEDWIRVLSDCRKATYENAILGSALVEKLKHAGTALEKEKEKAMLEAEEKAMALSAERDRKWQMMKEHMDLEKQNASVLSSKLSEAQQLSSAVDEAGRAVEEKRLEKLRQAELREESERALAQALEQLKQLEAALKDRHKEMGGIDEAKFKKNLATIKEFFDGVDEASDDEDD